MICEACGGEVLFLSEETVKRCPVCGTEVFRDLRNPSFRRARNIDIDYYISRNILPHPYQLILMSKYSENKDRAFEDFMSIHGGKLLILDKNINGKKVSNDLLPASVDLTLLHPFDYELFHFDPRDLTSELATLQNSILKEYEAKLLSGELFLFADFFGGSLVLCDGIYTHEYYSYDSHNELFLGTEAWRYPELITRDTEFGNKRVHPVLLNIFKSGEKCAQELNQLPYETRKDTVEHFGMNIPQYFDKSSILFAFGRNIMTSCYDSKRGYLLSTPITIEAIDDFLRGSTDTSALIKAHERNDSGDESSPFDSFTDQDNIPLDFSTY